MTRFRSWAGLLGVLLVCTPAPAEATRADRYAGADELASRIDGLMGAAWKKADVTPARLADDAEWLRRVYLDLAGRIPSVTEARSFLKDRRNDKRQRLVESLLAGQAAYPTYFASIWRSLLTPEANDNPRVQARPFEAWLREWLASGRGYDWMVRELLASPNQPQVRGGPVATSRMVASFSTSPRKNKPEEVAAAASRLFLGVNLGCAQCHNHPFATWKREQFWSFAAFFSSTQGRGRVRGERRPAVAANQLMIPGTDKVVKAKFLNGKEPSFENGEPGQKVLVDWITATDNPYFARAAVNRLWEHFFGAGLIEPLDEMVGAETSQSHPAVLDELAGAFTKSRSTIRGWLIRVITATKAYQLTSARSHPSQDDPRQFARMALRGMNGEQLFDSVAQATGYRDEAFAGRGNPFGLGGGRYEFVTKFAASTERPAETQTSILQALTLMNGRLMTSATSLQQSETLVAVIDAPFMDVPAKIETLYLAALSRKPTAKELARLTRYVEKGGGDRTAAP